MLGGGSIWVRFSSHFRYLQHRRFCNNNNNPTSLTKQPPSTNGNSSSSNNDGGRNSIRDLEGYRDLDKLDFTKAAKILFSDTPRKKKFGVDFHLVQLFFALLPSFAVYLVAQYARHEMRKMEAELEEKKKAEEEKKAKETEKLAEEERGHGSDPELLKVKERLEALEETIKEIVVEAKKQSSDEKSTRGNQNQEGPDPKRRSGDSHAAVGKQYTPQPGLGQEQKHQDRENRGSHQVDKK